MQEGEAGDSGEFQTAVDRIKIRKDRIKIRKEHRRKKQVSEIGKGIYPHYFLESVFKARQ